MEKPSNSGWSHLWFLGMGPNRASERFQSYKESKGLSSIGHLALAILEHAPVIGGTISFLDRVISHYTSPTTAKVTPVAYSVLATGKSKAGSAGKEQISQIKNDTQGVHCFFDIQNSKGSDNSVQGKCYAFFDHYKLTKIADNTSKRFELVFPSLLRQKKDIQTAFQIFVDGIYDEVNKSYSDVKPAFMCYFDAKTNITHTVILGNKQAYIVRKQGDNHEKIPIPNKDNLYNVGNNVNRNCFYAKLSLEENDEIILDSVDVNQKT
jgi:hypothetical protein